MVSCSRHEVYCSWHKWRAGSSLAVTWSGGCTSVPVRRMVAFLRTGVTLQKKCNNGAASRKITFCQKNSSVENVLQPPLTSSLHHSPTGLLWGLHGVHSRLVRTPQLASACLCSDRHYNSTVLTGRFSVPSCFLSSPNSTVGADEICW